MSPTLLPSWGPEPARERGFPRSPASLSAFQGGAPGNAVLGFTWTRDMRAACLCGVSCSQAQGHMVPCWSETHQPPPAWWGGGAAAATEQISRCPMTAETHALPKHYPILSLPAPSTPHTWNKNAVQSSTLSRAKLGTSQLQHVGCPCLQPTPRPTCLLLSRGYKPRSSQLSRTPSHGTLDRRLYQAAGLRTN